MGQIISLESAGGSRTFPLPIILRGIELDRRRFTEGIGRSRQKSPINLFVSVGRLRPRTHFTALRVRTVGSGFRVRPHPRRAVAVPRQIRCHEADRVLLAQLIADRRAVLAQRLAIIDFAEQVASRATLS